MDINIGQNIGQSERTKIEKRQVDIKDSNVRSQALSPVNEYGKLFVLKTERITSAIYLVSNLFSDSDPIKWTIRKSSTDLLMDIVFLERDKRGRGQDVVYEKIKGQISSIISLLDVSWMGGLVSKMNYEILKTECVRLLELINKKIFDGVSPSISPDFFVTEKIKEEELRAGKLSEERRKIEEKLILSLSESRTEDVYSEKLHAGDLDKKISFLKERLESRTEPFSSATSHIANSEGGVSFISSPMSFSKNLQKLNVPNNVLNVSDKNKTKRHDTIISSLKPGISYTVPEILGIIGMGAELSEKTIQRDLIYLVSVGLLKKTGERRWSRYSLPETL